MTRLFNDPAAFADEMIEGFVAANRRHVRAVPGGVVRGTRSEPGSVAVVIGGGSGHYPAFGGLVGAGIAHGAAMGNLFASPSRQQVHSVAAAAEHGGGILLTYGNYAGDVLNFDAAQEQLRAEGFDCRTVLVTDDVSSAPASERSRRRGIAGDLVVFKIAGAAAEAGYSLDEAERVSRLANDRTRSFGVAFSGCTLPGAAGPLFTVPDGRMALGLGIHGEPGVGETAVPTADELAALFVDTLLGELPDGVGAASGQRAAVVLNGLGSVKYEELFVVYRRVGRLLEQAGVEIVDPEVGEFCTSFDMAGASLTLLWLDDELEALWCAPADAPAFRKGALAGSAQLDDAELTIVVETLVIPAASRVSREAAVTASRALETLSETVDAHVDELGRLDAVAGDGDHGIGMQRGAHAAIAAAREALDAGAGAGTLLELAGDAWADRAGGTSGALWGLALRALGERLGDDLAPDGSAVSEGVDAALAGITRYGRAQPGDKTMVDALVPFAEALRFELAGGARLSAAWIAAATVATEAAAATADIPARLGRARTHGDASLGTVDPGAHSFALIATAIGALLSESGETT
jgi:dihydroxyacetone kinase